MNLCIMKKANLRIRLKELIFSYYWLLFSLGISITIYLYFLFELDKEIVGTIVGGLFAYFYFMQKQKLDEIAFFRQLFSEFNEKYNRLNDDLATVLQEKAIGNSQKELVDYFNLCSEEYLMFERGFIPLKVWNSWLFGMHQYWQINEVQVLWLEEISTESYYGFNPSDHFENLEKLAMSKPKAA